MSETEQLFSRYINNQCSPEEVEALMLYFHTDEQNNLNRLILLELENAPVDSGNDYRGLLKSVYSDIESQIHKKKKTSKKMWYKVAAAILLFLSTGGYFVLQKTIQQRVARGQDISFGTNQAILKLGQGKTLVLDSTHNGLIAQQGKISVSKSADGKITYATSPQATGDTPPVYDTLINPAGSKTYHLILSDGSKLILNAATTIRFPEFFPKTERNVELLTGEVYFEVSHKKTQPFHVYTRGQIINDLGTRFNISAYQDEQVTKVTLLEGSVKIVKGNQSLTLKPGQQAVTGSKENIQLLENIVTDEAVAWKEGVFSFNKETLASIMRKIARWYDVSVVYSDDSVKALTFGAVTTRFANVSQVLKMLERTGEVHFKIDGKKIIVSK